MISNLVLSYLVLGVPLLFAMVIIVLPTQAIPSTSRIGAFLSGLTAMFLSISLLCHPKTELVGKWLILDPLAGLFVAIIGAVGTASILLSPSYLRDTSSSVVTLGNRDRVFFCILFIFLAMLYAVPLAGNIGAAWLLVEGTTATSALLVGFSGKRRALEAAWKYLILTSVGMGVALLGIALLADSSHGGGLGGLTWKALGTFRTSHSDALIAFVLVLVGFASKIGWAPVHNWLPDAHSEASPPISGLLSAALLPSVLLVAWRFSAAVSYVIGTKAVHEVLIAFGLVSLTIAVPFLWQPLPWKRLLAYSSLEHMGILALGIGFGGPLALAGVVIHIVGHAIAKSLGFYSATPLLAHDPRSSKHCPSGIGRSCPKLGASMGISLATLSGLPPLPLFASELLIMAGGFETGHGVVASIAALLLAFGFIGLIQAFLTIITGDSHHHNAESLVKVRVAGVFRTGIVSLGLLLGLTYIAFFLPSSILVHDIIYRMR